MKAVATFLLLLNYLTSCHGWTCTAPAQQFPAAQLDAGQGMVVMTDENSNVFYLSGSSWSKLGSVPLKHVSVGPAGIWGVDHQDKVHKFTAGDFFPTCALELEQVDAGGEGQVVGVASTDSIHCLNASSALSVKEEGALNWNTLQGRLVHISCAPTGCWGVNAGQSIYFTKISTSCSMNNWTNTDGTAVHVEVGSDGNVFVVNQSGNLYERTGISNKVPQGTDWKQIKLSVSIKHASYDLGRLWLVTKEGFILECTN